MQRQGHQKPWVYLVYIYYAESLVPGSIYSSDWNY